MCVKDSPFMLAADEQRNAATAVIIAHGGRQDPTTVDLGECKVSRSITEDL
jgi:hypothetical protein